MYMLSLKSGNYRLKGNQVLCYLRCFGIKFNPAVKQYKLDSDSYIVKV